ncbi:MAG TPA: gliding motility-associated C-terminal domain-containing protein, partial [Bacteroidia bacterium]|nr:gliding motility-associated C-terminal domain-containing protein [Bacteroidia bacterium]
LNVEPCNNQNGVSTPAVPSAFTPNGDGNNDILYVRGGPFSLFDFRVFNEWGNEIFHSVVQSNGWDGKINGAPQPEGSYVWTLAGTTVDGKSIKMTGDVTLLR